MQAAKKIEPQSWMTQPESRAVMAALDAGVGGQAALFVGGCVRNALLDKAAGDIDIATVYRPEEVLERLGQAGIKAIPTGLDHGTVTAVADDQSFEITTLRRDVETDGRHAVVAYTDDWREDANRRDFTMNTLLCDTEGNVYDPTGQGLDDLEAGRVLFVGNAAQRIQEDYLRILRFFRFHAYYGRGAPDQNAIFACRQYAHKIETLSRERITQEFFKILEAPAPADILTLMFENGVLSGLPAKDSDLACLGKLPPEWRSVRTQLVILSGYEMNAFLGMEDWLVFTNILRRQVDKITGALSALEFLDEQVVKELIYRYGNEAAGEIIALHQVKAAGGVIPGTYQDLLHNWRAPDFPLSGADVMAAGVPEGPDVGRVLSMVEDWWIESGFTAERGACLERLQRAVVQNLDPRA